MSRPLPCEADPMPDPNSVLLVEDDDAIAETLVGTLQGHGFHVRRVATGAEALAYLDTELVLLDLGLPDIDGLDVCRSIRSISDVPIIVITARGEDVDRIVGLELGADDYLVKPFNPRELVARMRAVLRRTNEPSKPARVEQNDNRPASDSGDATHVDDELLPVEKSSSEFTTGVLRVDLRSHRVFLNDREVPLTVKEFGVLAILAADPGAVVTRSELLERVWDEHWYGPTKTLDVHIAQLRRKLGDPGWIETVRSVGYRLVDPAVPVVL